MVVIPLDSLGNSSRILWLALCNLLCLYPRKLTHYAIRKKKRGVNMRSAEVENFLTERGFKFYAPHRSDPDFVVANYYRVLYGLEGLPLCLTNEKPPQVYIRESHIELPNQPYHSFNMGICNEAPQGWIDFKFYSVSEDDLFEKFTEMELALIASWRTLFSLNTE
jgi:hypothetical protein